MTDEQTESLARARGKHPEQASEKEELELLDEEFLDDMYRNQRGHQRGNGKNQGKE